MHPHLKHGREDSQKDQENTIRSLANDVTKVMVNGQFDDNRTFIDDPAIRQARQLAAARDTALFSRSNELLLESIIGPWSQAIRDYSDTHNSLPGDDLMASAAQAFLNASAGNQTAQHGMLFESIGAADNTSDAINVTALQTALILPVQLLASSSQMVTSIPGNANATEIYHLDYKAGNSFGDFNVGDNIDIGYTGQYTNMQQIHQFGVANQPDGVKKVFAFDTALDTKVAAPVKKFSVTVMLNQTPLAQDNGGGVLVPSSTNNALTGTVNYVDGKITVTLAVAPLAGAILDVQLDIDIEKKPGLIPSIQYEIDSVELRPHQSVIGQSHTLQGYWQLRRQHGNDASALLGGQQRNMMSFEKDIQNIRLALYAASANPVETFDLKWSDTGNHTAIQHYRLLTHLLNDISTDMLNKTQTTGIKGYYVGASACTILMAMGEGFFTPAPNYVKRNSIHFVGRLIGGQDIYVVPHEIKITAQVKLTTFDMLAYGRGDHYTQAGLVNGDSVSPILIPQGNVGFTTTNALWCERYQDINPHDGRRYFRKISLIPSTE
jgi:hypothetical protein